MRRWVAHLFLSHGHGVDRGAERVDGDGLGGAEFFAAVLADEDDGEGVGSDVEAQAGGGLFGGRQLTEVRTVDGVAPRSNVVAREDGENDDVTLAESF